MARFLSANLFMPIVSGLSFGNWKSGQTFRFYERDDKTGPFIEVKALDESNGADVPPAWVVFLAVFILAVWPLGWQDAAMGGLLVAALSAWLLPRIHAAYISAVFVHDIGLKKFRHIFSRRRIDKMFLKAMRLVRQPLKAAPNGGFKALVKWALSDLPIWFWRLVRPYIMFAGVSFWGVLSERQNYFKPVPAKGN